MNRSLLSILFCALLLATFANALTYRADVNNGSWSQYNAGLTSDYYANDLTQATYNRGFETTIASLTDTACVQGWCRIGTTGTFNTSTNYSVEGVNSFYTLVAGGNTTIFFSQTEQTGDSNVSFAYKETQFNGSNGQIAYYGYVNDNNNFVSVGSLPINTGWQYVSYKIPNGNFRLAIYIYSGTANTAEIYFDNITITRNNAGTFSKFYAPTSCNSISSCSNVSSFLPAKQLADLYYVADYVSGATCTYSTTSGHSGAMIEGLGGIYYFKFDENVTSGFYKDLNISATCSKIPYATKSFFASARLYRYGKITNGDFSSSFSGAGCSNGFCRTVNGGSITTSTPTVKDFAGNNKLLYVNSPAVENNFFSLSDYAGGEQIQFSFAVQYAGSENAYLSWGYVNDSNTYTEIGRDAVASERFVQDWNTITYSIPSGQYRPAFVSHANVGTTRTDFIALILSSGSRLTSTMTTKNSLAYNTGLKGTNYLFSSRFVDETGAPITGATCTITIGTTPYTATYNPADGNYETTQGFITDGTYAVTHACTSTTYNNFTATPYNITIGESLTGPLDAIAISGIGAITKSDTNSAITLNGADSSADLIFKAKANTQAYSFTTNWQNSSTAKKAYFVYTSTDGINWAFDDTITFGAGTLFSDGLQKIWNGSTYNYSFNATLAQNTWKYFKISFQNVPLQWQTIKTSSDWVNINDPTAWNDSANHYYDTFQDSNYTNIQTYTAQNFQNLIGSGITAGYELQFTAYATADTNLEVGSRTGSTDTTSTISLTTTAKRFSVPINPSAWTSLLLFKSTNTIGQIVYISDYAIVPRSYFYGRLDITQNNGDPLQAILRDGNSNIYLREAVPFKVVTNSYDSSGTINKLRVQVLIGSIAIKTYDFNITPSAGQITNWNETLQGVIDLNGTAGIYNALAPLRDITIQATLYNTSGNSVAQQYQTIKLLQYPYFPQDFTFSIDTTNKKLGKPASFSLNFTQLDPSYFIGFEFSIYDGNHTLTNPNFQQTILANQLNCSSLYACSKSITFNEFVYPAETMYNVTVVGLFKTENKTYQNLLTIRGLTFPVSASAYETARVLQVFERRDANIIPHSYYKPTETIPLVLQIRDDSYANLQNEVKPYMKLRVNGSVLYNTTAFLPTKFIYDETTGYNYWYFNDLLIDDSGDLFETGDTIQPIVYLVSNTGGHTSVSADPITYSLKCVTYPSDFFNGSLLMNAIGFIGDATFGCTVDANILVTASNSNQHLDMNQLYTPTSTVTQSVLCLRADLNTAYKAQLGDDLLCVIAYTKSEEMIDGFKVRVGNDNSDYAVTDSTKQYIEFPISGEQVIFNDLGMIRNSLEAEYNTQNIHTYGQLIGAGFQHMLNYSGVQNIADFGSWLTDVGFVQNVGFDLNLSETFTPTSAHGLFFVRISGLKVINQYDYVSKYPELQSISAKNFLTYMRSKGEKVTIGKTTAYVGNFGSSNAFNVIAIDSPLIIYETPTKSSSADANGVTTSSPTNLKFYFISDLLSNNETRAYRAYVPIWFAYTVPAHFDISKLIDDILYGKDGFGNDAGLFTNPLGFGLKNWFWFVILVLVVLAISYIKKNWGAGGSTTNIINKR